jgi:uncharacterized protein (DUF1499 family)
MKLSNINKIITPKNFHFPSDTRGIPGLALQLEKAGDFIATPGRRILGSEYIAEKQSNGKYLLLSPERFSPLAKIAAVALFPLTLIATLFGLALKALAHKMYPELADKYSLPTVPYAREAHNFAGKLPQNPISPNCVNSQQKSIWGKLYNADPIEVPGTITEPVAVLKRVLASVDTQGLKASNFQLVEERPNYLHYTYTVVIPTGPLKGTYIDDVDVFYNKQKSHFDIRSASRTGFRDAVHANFKVPGANKKRIEAIREAFTKSVIKA